MSQNVTRFWLAREGKILGLYEKSDLIGMDAGDDLMPADCLCGEGSDAWLDLEAWRRSVTKPRQTVIRPKVGGSAGIPTPKTTRLKLASQPLLATLPGASKPTAADARTEPVPAVRVDPQRRLASICDAMLADRRSNPHRHPFYFVQPQQITEVLAALDQEREGWDQEWARTNTATAAQELLDKWVIPMLAKLKPDLIKPSHSHEFGPDRAWRFPD